MRIRAMVIRILRQFIGDKRTMAMMIAAPLLIMSLLYLVFNGGTYEPAIGAVQVPQPVIEQWEQQDAAVTVFAAADEAEAALHDGKIDAYMQMTNGSPSIRLEGSDPAVTRVILMTMQSVVEQLSAQSAQSSVLQPEITYLYGSKDMASFDNFGPVLIGFFAFFFVFIISGVAFLRERTGGTLEKLLSTPIRRSEIVIGYVLGFGIFTMIQAALIAWYSIDILGMMMTGSFWLVLLITLLLALTALTLGTLLSAFASNEFQMIQFIPLIIVPQVFFSGLFSLDTMSDWLRGISVIMPLKYGADALRNIMIRGQGWSEIALDVYILLGLSIIFMLLNVLALRKHRKI